ncbi:MAG: flagellar basal body L-ring protein FlgH [Pirellulales bacterium]
MNRLRNANFAIILFSCFAASLAVAQEGPVSSLARRSLPGVPGQTNGYASGTMQDMNWQYRELPPPKVVQLYDIIHISVDEKSQLKSEGEMERRKIASYTSILTDWLRIEDQKSLKPQLQADGDQTIAGNLNKLFRAEGDLETKESIKFKIASMVSEVLPNGNLKLEAQKEIFVNEEKWIYHLRGICRTEDIAPGNIVLSEHLANLSITKTELGHVRDSYRRGWLLNIMDRIQWF